MSFILDALRKLEEKQVAETTRELLGKEGAPSRRPRGRRVRPRTAAVVLLGGGCLLAALFLLRGENRREDEEGLSRVEHGVNSPVSAPAAAEPETVGAAGAAPEAAVSPAAPAEAGGEKAGLTGEVFRPLPAGSTGGRGPAPMLAPEAETLPPGEKEDAEAREGASSPGADDAPAEEAAEAGIVDGQHPAPDGGVVPFENLPDEIRAPLRDLHITGHIFSEDRSFRRLNVNDSMRKEGDILPDGVRIDEVTETGAVFSYRGYRFFLGGF